MYLFHSLGTASSQWVCNTSHNRTTYCTTLVFLFLKQIFIYLLSLWCFQSDIFFLQHVYQMTVTFIFQMINQSYPPHPQTSLRKSTALLSQWRWVPLWTCYSVVILGHSVISRVRAPFLCPVTFCLVCCFIFSMAYVPVVAQEWVQKAKLIQLSFFSPILSFEAVWPSVKF